MPRKRIYNTVRTDKFESDIAHYTACHNYEAAEALWDLAHDCGAPIDETKITVNATQRRKYYRGRL